MTAFCGMSMSSHALPFLYGMAPLSFVRITHLSMSHWSFVLMGLHLGLHIPVILKKYQLNDRTVNIIYLIALFLGGVGLFLFLRNKIFDYMLYKTAFAFFDYDKSFILVFIENILMLLFWVLVGSQCALLLQNKKNRLLPILFIVASIAIGLISYMFIAGNNNDNNWNIENNEEVNLEYGVVVSDRSLKIPLVLIQQQQTHAL